MDLGRYIYQVLKHRNEVYVKGLGVFKRIHTSSVFDERKAVYLPPMTYLEFDPKSVEGVDLLDYVQQANQVSRSDAEALVEEAVFHLFEQIKDHGQVSLHHLGQLIRHGSSLVFKAEDLSGFQLEPIEGGDVRPTVEETILTEEASAAEEVVEEPSTVEEPIVESEVEVAEPETAEEPEQEEIPEEQVAYEEVEPTRSSNKAGWYIAASIIALMIIGAVIFMNRQSPREIIDKTDSLNHPDELPVESQGLKQDSLTNADSLVTKTDSLPKLDSSKVQAPVVNKPLIPAGHHYSIVIGKHATLAQAFDQAESFNKAGVTSVRVIPSKLAHNKKTVIWDTFATKVEADSALRVVQKRYVSDAWVQKLN